MKPRSFAARFVRAFLLRTLLGVTSLPVLALDPNLPPSGNFDLTKWNITLPVDSSGGYVGTPITIPPSQLSAGDSYPPYFRTGPDGAMVFGVPYNGAAGGPSSHPRSELRECHPNDTLHNWKPGDHSGTHLMDAICVVENVGNGKVAIGQIHAKEPNVPASSSLTLKAIAYKPGLVDSPITTASYTIAGGGGAAVPAVLEAESVAADPAHCGGDANVAEGRAR